LAWFSIICLYEITKQRPKVVYVTSDPPLLVPFVVFFCSKLFGFSYVYHVQDIHPEATQVAVKNLNKLVAFVAKRMDTLSLNNAAKIITLTEEMKVTLLCNRNAGLWNKIDLIDNPTGLTAEAREGCVKRFDFAFVGTMGRLQRIPLLATSIGNYLRKGGDKKFVFVGDGIHAKTVQKLMSEFPANVFYFGRLTVEASSQIISESKALLVPIEDEVCNFAFPSKIATYAASSSPLVCICGERTSVARWVLKNNAGFVVQPTNQGLEGLFKRASLTFDSTIGRGHSVKRKKNIFSKEEFARKLHDILIKTLY
jgi:glycosyltransferase involved in cell wall biosynthesis